MIGNPSRSNELVVFRNRIGALRNAENLARERAWRIQQTEDRARLLGRAPEPLLDVAVISWHRIIPSADTGLDTLGHLEAF